MADVSSYPESTGAGSARIRARIADAESEATPFSEQDCETNPFTLRFRSRRVEDQFTYENYQRQIGVTRFSIAMAAVVLGVYGILDYFIVPEILYEAWLLRFGIACPIMLGLVALSYASWFGHRHIYWLSLAMLTPNMAVLAMIAIADAPGNYLYIGGVLVIIAVSASVWRMSYLYSTAMSLTTFLLYNVVAVLINPIESNVLINNNAFLFLAVIVNGFVNYVQEQQLRRSFVDNQKLIVEQQRSEILLRQSEAANRAKNDFLAVMSHELRTPLNAIIGFSEIIANQMFGRIEQEKYRDYALDINSSGSHLLGIINDILDISKAEAGKLELNEEPIDPVDTLNQTMRMFRQRAGELKVDLSFRVRDEIPWLIADARLFNQVAINLTSNALKFTPEGGSVLVEIGLSESGDLTMNIEDTGIGIRPGDLDRVFEPFVQVEGALNRTHQGTGLGLPLVRKIMLLHGGTVELESEVGQGTKITAAFPSSRFVAPSAKDDLHWASQQSI